MLGAVYHDGGYEAARRIVERFFLGDVTDKHLGQRDYKTRFQEISQMLFHVPPIYRLVAEPGPDHDKVFVTEIAVGGKVLGNGEGKSKKMSEQEAANWRCWSCSRAMLKNAFATKAPWLRHTRKAGIQANSRRTNLDSRCHGNDDQEKVEFESTQVTSLRSITRTIGTELNRAGYSPMADLSTDVLIVGAGGAGMYAAIAAARGGASVLLLDKAK